ncbi:sugar O-acetyltransferase [Vagococcus sp.]|uniref:sugar O-acetyltransferase n=1 Tax=Vagococcus sp. TaxID=1933889 RepID=UPI003F950610
MTRYPEYERMIAEKLYFSKKIEEDKKYTKHKRLAQKINQTPLDQPEEISRLEKELFGSTGENLYLQPPVYVDYGFNTHVGENFYANVGCFFMDVAPIEIGNNVMLGPGVQLLTPSHPIDAGVRGRGLEFGKKIKIGNDVWLGGNVVVNPGVTIGNEVIIGSGSVVTKNIEDGVIAAGNPARVIRKITDEDRLYWEAEEKAYFKETENS